jgi:hypothetical protein
MQVHFSSEIKKRRLSGKISLKEIGWRVLWILWRIWDLQKI